MAPRGAGKGCVMAWMVGAVDKRERKELEARGWKLEDPAVICGGRHGFPADAVVVHVDNDLFKIMDGPDWEKSHTAKGVSK